MFLIVLGIILFLAAVSIAQKGTGVFVKHVRSIRLISYLMIGAGILSSCVKQIDAGFVGVQSFFGKVQNTILPSGLSLVNPLMNVTQMDVRTQNYTMSGQHDEGTVTGDDAIRVLTADGLEVTIDLSPPYLMNRRQASTFGPMLPAGNWLLFTYCMAFSREIFPSPICRFVP